MQPLDIQPIGDEAAINWEDGTETFISQSWSAALP